MLKVLIVGLGGSGGKTLAFLMDELKVRLGDEWDGRLPESWKFVHIDVPAEADAQGSNLAQPVAAQGGKYVGISGRNASYPTFDTAAMSALKNQRPSALDMAARWRPNPKRAASIAVAGGAGAFRAVGRVVTLAGASSIYSALKTAIDELSSSKSTQDLARVSAQVGAPQSSGDGKPLVLIVSSLAGGSGASMVLDVADMLRGLTGPNFDGCHSAAFLYTADVFASVGIPSAGPGSLATISELLSALNRQEERWTSREWEALGIANAAVPGPDILGRGPLVVFPVGAKSEGVPFGNSPEDVYRGFSRMLAPLFIDNMIQVDFYNYVTVNFLQEVQASGDNTGLARDKNSSGENAQTSISHFSAWGSAVLSMGRNRYTEYAAQRIARQSVEVMVNGYQDNDFIDGVINLQQAIQKNVDALYPIFLEHAKLSAVSGSGSPDSKQFLQVVCPTSVRTGFGASKSSELASCFKGDGPTTAQTIHNQLNRELKDIKAQAVTESLRAISSWSPSLQRHVEDAFLHIASIKGLRVAIGCLSRLANDIGSLQLDLDNKVATTKSELNDTIQKGLTSIKAHKNVLNPAAPIARTFLGGYSQQLALFFGIELAKVLSPILGDFCKNFIKVLIASAEESLQGLDTELRKTAKGTVTAAFREAPVALWPKEDGLVPTHFQPAINEVLIDGTSQFPQFFDAHVAQAVSPLASGQVLEAARQIMTRYRLERKSDNEYEPVVGWAWKRTPLGSHPNIDRIKEWQPKELSSVTGQAQESAEFSLKFAWSDLLRNARDWVDLPGCPFRQHSDQGIKSWLNPEETISQQERVRRENLLIAKFKETLTFASPLVEIDQNAVKAIHGNAAEGTKYSISEVPLDTEHSVIQNILNSWSGSGAAAENSSELKKSCDSTQDRSEIFILGRPFRPYLPMVFESLNKPIRDSWQTAVSREDTNFWQWRRARPLRFFVPISQRRLAAFVHGWVAGRISGDIQLDDSTEGKSKVVKVRDPENGKWISFPNNLLGVTSLGEARDSFGGDESDWNVPAALLESLPLAMSQTQGQDQSAIRPYVAVMELGYSLKTPQISTNSPTGGSKVDLNVLDSWYNTGGSSGFEPQVPLPGQYSEDRRENASLWLDDVIRYMKDILEDGVSEDKFYETNREYEIAPEVIEACEAVLRELERDGLGSADQVEGAQAREAGSDSSDERRRKPGG
jgi:hypothetical protein